MYKRQISYLTAGQPEVRAWTIKKGTKAPQAAGKIHTDFEKGFIRAEVISFEDLIACGTMSAAKEKGLVRLEGKDYVCLLYTSCKSMSFVCVLIFNLTVFSQLKTLFSA